MSGTGKTYITAYTRMDKNEKTNSGKGWFYSIFDLSVSSLIVFAERLGFEPIV